MNREELREYGQNLLDKGRRPGDVRIAFKSRDADPELKEEVLTELFHVDQQSIEAVPKKKRVGADVLAANKLKLKYSYSMRTLYRIPLLLLAVGIVVLVVSSEEVNMNNVFGINTCVQALVLGVLFVMAKTGKQNDFLSYGVASVGILFLIELILWGIPNDLFMALNEYEVHYTRRSAIVRLIGFIFPYVYLATKVGIIALAIQPALNWKKYNSLSTDMKASVDALK